MPTKIKMITIPLLIEAILMAVATLFLLLGGVLSFGVSLRQRVGMGGGFIFFVIAIGTLVWGIVSFITYQAVKERKEWGHVLSIIIAVLMLFNFPVGTTLGILILIGNFSDEAKAWFVSSTPPTPPTVPTTPTPPVTPAA